MDSKLTLKTKESLIFPNKLLPPFESWEDDEDVFQLEDWVSSSTEAEGREARWRIWWHEGCWIANPLIWSWNCKGDQNLIHVEWLKNWLNTKKNERESEHCTSLSWKTFQCEVWQKPFPYSFKNNGFAYDLVDVIQPSCPHLILESMSNDRNTSRFIFIIKIPDFDITLSEDPSIKRRFTIGRGHESDFRIPDISVSRSHTEIEYWNGKFKVTDKQSKFGTLLKVSNGKLETLL